MIFFFNRLPFIDLFAVRAAAMQCRWLLAGTRYDGCRWRLHRRLERRRRRLLQAGRCRRRSRERRASLVHTFFVGRQAQTARAAAASPGRFLGFHFLAWHLLSAGRRGARRQRGRRVGGARRRRWSGVRRVEWVGWRRGAAKQRVGWVSGWGARRRRGGCRRADHVGRRGEHESALRCFQQLIRIEVLWYRIRVAERLVNVSYKFNCLIVWNVDNAWNF